jgi:hypothetical protein
MKNIITKKYIIIMAGVALALVVAHVCYTSGPRRDAVTARAVAELLARAAISDADLSAAMDIQGVRDAYVLRTDQTISMPARRQDDAVQVDDRAAGAVVLNGGERVVVEAYGGSQPPQMPLFLILPFAVGGAFLIARKRSVSCRNQNDENATDVVQASDSIGIELASRAADAALIRIDQGCRVVAASERAKGENDIAASGGHVIDILWPEEVQSVLQLIRRCEREGCVAEDVRWRGAILRVSVLKDGPGFLLKLSKELCDGPNA